MEDDNFRPDLILEATAVCNRKCPGCYASNVLSQVAPHELYRSAPELFLNPKNLKSTLDSIPCPIGSIAIRGGEPSLHPELSMILDAACSTSPRVYLETHGRWILSSTVDSPHRAEGNLARSPAPPAPEQATGLTPSRAPAREEGGVGPLRTEGRGSNPVPTFLHPGLQPRVDPLESNLLSACARSGVIVKVSFDRMHGLKETELKEIVSRLDLFGVEWRIAVTEATESESVAFLTSYPWIPRSKVIYQKKALYAEELIKPRLGVVKTDGKLSSNLSTHFAKVN